MPSRSEPTTPPAISFPNLVRPSHRNRNLYSINHSKNNATGKTSCENGGKQHAENGRDSPTYPLIAAVTFQLYCFSVLAALLLSDCVTPVNSLIALFCVDV